MDKPDEVLAMNNEVACGVSKERIIQLQESMMDIQCKQPEPRHFFAPGMYLRELTVPAGMLIVGKTHKHAHFLIVTTGRAEVISEFGREIVTSGHISVSQAGVKRVVLAIEDTQFITIHVNSEDSRDLEVIEQEHIEPELSKTIECENRREALP